MWNFLKPWRAGKPKACLSLELVPQSEYFLAFSQQQSFYLKIHPFLPHSCVPMKPICELGQSLQLLTEPPGELTE